MRKSENTQRSAVFRYERAHPFTLEFYTVYPFPTHSLPGQRVARVFEVKIRIFLHFELYERSSLLTLENCYGEDLEVYVDFDFSNNISVAL